MFFVYLQNRLLMKSRGAVGVIFLSISIRHGDKYSARIQYVSLWFRRVCVRVIRSECKKLVFSMFTFELHNINDFICCFDDAILARTHTTVRLFDVELLYLLVSKSKKVSDWAGEGVYMEKLHRIAKAIYLHKIMIACGVVAVTSAASISFKHFNEGE